MYVIEREREKREKRRHRVLAEEEAGETDATNDKITANSSEQKTRKR
jgi:hypothetical protein